MHAEHSLVLRYSFGTPGRCDSSVLKDLNQRFCANKGLVSSCTVKMHRKGKTALGGIKGELNDCLTCWDFLMERKHFSNWNKGLWCCRLLRTANPNPHYLPLFFMLIFLSSSIKIRDCKRSLPRFEVMNTQAFGEVNSRKTEDLSGLRQSPLLSDTAVSSMHLARGTQFSALSYFSLVCSSP